MKKTTKMFLTLTVLILARLAFRSEFDKGICLTDDGDGKVYNGEPYYNYINYSRTDASEGDELITYELLNPLNNYCDDIVLRIDYNTTTKRISWN